MLELISLRELLKRSVTLRLLARWGRVHTYAYPRWRTLLERDRAIWDDGLAKAKRGPKILIATSVGGHPHAVALESLLGAALTLRGADVHFLLCDSLLPACELAETGWFPDHRRFVRRGPQGRLCMICFPPANRAYGELGLRVHKYRDFLGAEDLQRAEQITGTLTPGEMEKYALDGIAIGEHAKAGALRFYARANLEGEPYAESVLGRYFKASLLTVLIAQRLFKAVDFASATFQHGIYVPAGLIGEVARKKGVRVVNWNIAYRKRRFIFSHGDTYHRTMMSEPTATWEYLDLTPRVEQELLGYLKSRWQGLRDWIGFHERPLEDIGAISRELGVDFYKPCIGMLTNVMWDAQLHYAANAFPSMLDWVVQTIAYFANRPELQLIIRVHPAEVHGTLPSRQPIVGEIRKRFPELPKNVFIIPPDRPISTYAVMLKCDSVIIYGTRMGVELTSQGIPVIVAGEAWIRGKGISMDASSPEDYFRLLDRLPIGRRLPESTVRRARTYAYHFFFRRMIPVDLVKPTSGWLPYRLDVAGLSEILPGRNIGLDVICKGILEGSEFLYPEEAGLVSAE